MSFVFILSPKKQSRAHILLQKYITYISRSFCIQRPKRETTHMIYFDSYWLIVCVCVWSLSFLLRLYLWKCEGGTRFHYPCVSLYTFVKLCTMVQTQLVMKVPSDLVPRSSKLLHWHLIPVFIAKLPPSMSLRPVLMRQLRHGLKLHLEGGATADPQWCWISDTFTFQSLSVCRCLARCLSVSLSCRVCVFVHDCVFVCVCV